jgi:HSF-type DNA-binding
VPRSYCFSGAYPSEIKPKGVGNASLLPTLPQLSSGSSGFGGGGARLNKFVRRLFDMLQAEKDSGIVEWRRGLLVLHSTDAFAKTILPKYFNTRNFKTFRRQVS